MSENKNHKNYIASLRGLILIWVLAFPVVIVLYGKFPEASITIMSIAVVLSILVIIIYPYRKRKTQKHSQPLDVLASDTKLVTYARVFLRKLDGFIFTFMFTMSGTMLVMLGNMFTLGVMVRVSKNSDRTPDPTVQLIFLGMVCSWFILWFFRWYMKKFYPDYHE